MYFTHFLWEVTVVTMYNMRNKMKFLSIVIISFLIIACSKNFELNEMADEKIISIENNDTNKNIINEPMPINYPIEKQNIFGPICYTNIIDNNVNVRVFPSLEAEIIKQVHNNTIIQIRGFSGENVNIDNFNGDWVYVYDNRTKVGGWVFSKYVNTADIEFTPINFVDVDQDWIHISYVLKDELINKKIWYASWRDYYIFIWGPDRHGFHYSTRPGIYFLHKETHELEHFTYAGALDGDDGTGWIHITDDLKYVIQDSGTSKGLRGITAWRCSDSKKIYSGIYYDYGIHENIIKIVYAWQEFSHWFGSPDIEIIEYAEKFIKENEIPEHVEEERRNGFVVQLLINCSMNLDSGERIILDGQYITTQ